MNEYDYFDFVMNDYVICYLVRKMPYEMFEDYVFCYFQPHMPKEEPLVRFRYHLN